MDDENVQEKPKNMELIIVEYVYNNPMIKHRDLKRELTKNNKRMTAKTLNTYLYGDNRYPIGLIDKKHILAHGERTYNRKKYDDIFEFNEEKIDYYPELIKKTLLDIKKKIVRLQRLECSKLDNQVTLYLDYLMDFNLNVELNQNPNSRQFYFSDNLYNRLRDLMKLLIFDCFLCNPDLWYVFEKREDLDFSINITTKYSKIPYLFEYLWLSRKRMLSGKKIFFNQFDRKYYSLIRNKRKNRELEHNNTQLFYAKAKLEHEEREKSNRNIQTKYDEWIETLKDPFKKYSLTEKDNKDYQKQLQESIMSDLEALTELRTFEDLNDEREKQTELEKKLGINRDFKYLIENKGNLIFDNGKWLKKKD